MKNTQQKLSFVAAVFAFLFMMLGTGRAQDTGAGGEPIVAGLDPSTLTYDLLVDGTLTQDDPAHGKYATLQAAYAAAPAGTAARQTVIGIMPNVYQITGTATTPGLTISKNYITLRGITNNRRSVVLADNKGNKEGAGTDTTSYNGYVIVVNATGFTAENLTILNYCNVDYEYPGDPSKNLSKRSAVITQAVAFQGSGDKHVYRNVAFLSRLDTTFMQTTRAYVVNSYLEGTADFLGGGTESVWQDSEITFPTGTGVMSASGVVFIRTKFTATQGFQFYKTATNPVALINCTVPVSTSQAQISWVNPAYGPAPTRVNLLSLTYHTKDTSGNPAVIADTTTGTPTYNLGRELSDQEALAFNPWNVLRATPTGVADDWDPANARSQYEAAGQGSLVYRMSVTNGNPSIRTGDAGAVVGATVAPIRVADPTIRWSTTSTLVTLSNTTGASITITGKNTTLEGQYIPVYATAADGFYAVIWVYVDPKYIDPPLLNAGPTIEAPKAGMVLVDYTLQLNGLQDQSVISWFACDDAGGASCRATGVSRGNLPDNPYMLTLGDVGKYLKVALQPKSNISDPGTERDAIAATPVLTSDVTSTTVSPNFRNFVATPVSTYVSGAWTVLGTWTSATGPTLVNGYGLRVASQGSSLLYQQDAPAADMQVDLYMTPEKTQGQGFGSPGAPDDGDMIQKSDIYIKYDPRTRNGYAVRFWRTTASTEKVMFQLFRISNGAGSPISTSQQLTGVFKPDTTISVKFIGNTFSVTGSNSADAETLSLQETVTPNNFGGSGVYWAGTTSSGNSNVYSMIKISYPAAATTVTVGSPTITYSNNINSVTLSASVAALDGAPTGTVTFMEGSAPLGMATLAGGGSTASATLNVVLKPGSHSIIAMYSGANAYSASVSSAVTLPVAAPAYSAAFVPATLTVNAGYSGAATATISPTYGYAGSFTVACGPMPASVTCSIDNPSLTVSSSSSVGTVVRIGTVGGTSATLLPMEGRRKGEILAAILGLPLLTGLASRRRRSGFSRLVLLSLLGITSFGTSIGLSGCANHPFVIPPTAAGTYQLPLTLTPAGGSATQLTLTLKVQ